MSRPIIIGLTGGIGSGKSVVSRILRLKGYPVYDCDSEAKRLMAESDNIKLNLRIRFGEECMHADGTINREHLSRCVFGSREDLDWLNALVHSEVRNDLMNWAQCAEGRCFVESAILKTSHLDEICEEIWLVDSPEDIRIERAMSRGGISLDNLRQRIEVQREEFDGLEKREVKKIKNYGGHSLLEQLSSLLINN